jgi:hypothetical protein
MAQEKSLQVMAIRIIVKGFPDRVNGCLREATGVLKRGLESLEKAGMSRELNFSEANLDVVDLVFAILTTEPDSPLAKALKHSARFQPAPQQLELAMQTCYLYVGEVACRCLGAEWADRKRFLGAPECGIQFPNGKFCAENQIHGTGGKALLPKEAYFALKALAKG